MKKHIKKIAKKLIPEGTYDKIIIPRHAAESAVANLRYGFPAHTGKMTIIGVTGTNGKTTTCNMLAAIFEAAGHKVGLTSSAVLQIGDKRWENNLHITTAKGMLMQKMLKQMKDAKVEFAIIETASHALVQRRVLGIAFDAAVMTNLTQDHLDYHKTMENYAAAKAKLFQKAKRFCILNSDDEWVETFRTASAGKSIFEYGKQASTTKLVSTNITPAGASFVVEHDGRNHSFFINLTGLFNVYNAMAAITTAWQYGLSDEQIQAGLDKLESVPGRMQAINEGQDFGVIIDHAHTPDALDNLYKAVKPTVKGRLIVVNGCDGDRDPKKRFPIGKMTAEMADIFYLTELENYTENPDKIFPMIWEGINTVPESKRAEVTEIRDRETAITEAIKRAKPGDLVLIPGIGAQDYRGMAAPDGTLVKIKWDDREVARKALRSLK